MNQLSWFIYMADVLPGAASASRITCTVIASILLIVTPIAGVIMTAAGDGDVFLAFAKKVKLFFAIPGLFFLAFLGNLVPQKETFYLIALSEGGEEVLKAPEFQKVRKAVNNWLDEQLKEGQPQ